MAKNVISRQTHKGLINHCCLGCTAPVHVPVQVHCWAQVQSPSTSFVHGKDLQRLCFSQKWQRAGFHVTCSSSNGSRGSSSILRHLRCVRCTHVSVRVMYVPATIQAEAAGPPSPLHLPGKKKGRRNEISRVRENKSKGVCVVDE